MRLCIGSPNFLKNIDDVRSRRDAGIISQKSLQLILGIKDPSLGLIPKSVKTDVGPIDEEWECGFQFGDRVSGGITFGPKVEYRAGSQASGSLVPTLEKLCSKRSCYLQGSDYKDQMGLLD